MEISMLDADIRYYTSLLLALCLPIAGAALVVARDLWRSGN